MVQYSKRGKDRVITLKQDVGIDQAEQFHKALQVCYEKANNVRIEMKKLESIDLSALQLLISAKQMYLSNGKGFSIEYENVDCIQNLLNKTGLII